MGDSWGSRIKSHAIWLLNWLLVVEVVFMAIRLGLQKADMTDVIAQLVWVAVYGATFYCLIIYGQDLADKIVNGFINLSQQVHGPKESISIFFSNSIVIAKKMGEMISVWAPAMGVAISLCMAISLISAALTYGMYLLILCEAWVVMNVGILILGFGGNRHTRGWAVNFLRYAIAVGLKLFMIQLLMNVIHTFVAQIVNWKLDTPTDVFVLTANFVICAFFVKALPDALASFVSNYTGSTASMMTGAMAAGVGVAAGAASMGAGAAMGASGGGGIAGGIAELKKERCRHYQRLQVLI